MPTVTVPQVNPNDEVTALSVNQGPNALAAVVNGQLDDANINTISGSKISAGTLPASASDISSNPETRESETVGDLVASGLIWSLTSGLTGTMTSGVAYVSGKRLQVAAVTSNAFTASRDTYVYVDSNGAIQYSPQTNNAAQPATPAGYVMLAKVVTNGSTITNIYDLRPTSVGSARRTWNVSWTNLTLGNGTVTARYTQVGKNVDAELTIVFGSTTAVTGAVSFSLPTVSVSTYNTLHSVLGVAYFDKPGSESYSGVTLWATSGTATAFVPNSPTDTRLVQLSASKPIGTLAAGTIFSFNLRYEAA
jgi:hypothetical protein